MPRHITSPAHVHTCPPFLSHIFLRHKHGGHLPQAHTHAIFLRHRLRHCPSGTLLAQLLRSYLSYLAGRSINPTHSYSPSSSGTSYVIVHLEHVHTCTTSSSTRYVIVHTSFYTYNSSSTYVIPPYIGITLFYTLGGRSIPLTLLLRRTCFGNKMARVVIKPWELLRKR